MGIPRRHTIPAELIAKHVREWANNYGPEYCVACDYLARQSGLNSSYFWKLYKGSYRNQVSFDVADRMFCAMGRPNLWYCDPELKEQYERVVKEADRLYPLAVAA